VNSSVLFILAANLLVAAEPSNENAIQESKKLEGAWNVTSVVRNRNELPSERLSNLQTTFREGRFAFKMGAKTLSEGTFQLDPGKLPRTIDLTSQDANGKQQTTRAIYDLSGDVLRICGAQPGQDRPRELEATDGSGHTLTTFERAK
jgi:uncharacterized protein (TIGR03067 family)